VSPAPETFADWLRDHPPHDEAFTQTLAGAAERTRGGEPFELCVRELLDELALISRQGLISRALALRPEPTGDPRRDAYLAALAEHVALTRGVERPGWCVEPSRFLDRFWFPSTTPGLRALALVHSPAAFRRRGIFLGPGALDRV